ncbi:elicitor-responsive protein 1-like [Cynara cardunculus var. scolymus]|uniref:C2 calcium-dependent membrane targeting n=1 Tax=Cynara cardunculus var. scolymus TaxID=59895 RepID=A0A103Y6G0_CYNCS|nr:elicitor-responsive protein 1-like [Cynara cardunculus var. scolymus]KVI03387.1 C2 calcium-dependent membrane targeting [Cynara cardunculus var. scolymus]
MTGGGILEVILVDSEGIRAKKFLGCLVCFGTSAVNKPYVCVEYGDQKRISKVAEEKGKKSIWDQKFEFEVDHAAESNKPSEKLVFHVMNKHKLSDDAYVGEATIHVKDVVLLGMEDGEAELGSRKYRVVRQDKSYTGDISVAVTFKRKDGVNTTEIRKESKPCK